MNKIFVLRFFVQRITPNSIDSKSSKKEELDDYSSISSRGERQTDDDHDGDGDDENIGTIPIGEEANTNTLIRQPHININKQEKSLISMINSSGLFYLFYKKKYLLIIFF